MVCIIIGIPVYFKIIAWIRTVIKRKKITEKRPEVKKLHTMNDFSAFFLFMPQDIIGPSRKPKVKEKGGQV